MAKARKEPIYPVKEKAPIHPIPQLTETQLKRSESRLLKTMGVH